MTDQQQQLLKLGEVAALLAVSTRTVERLIVSGEIVAVRVGGSRRVAASALAAYLERIGAGG